MARRIVLTSGKGGVGKTTVCAGLGIALAKRGARVLLVDADVGLNNLDVALGMESRIIYDMTDVLRGRCSLRQAILQDSEYSTLSLLASSHGVEDGEFSSAAFRRMLAEAEGAFDFVLIDCPAGIDVGFHRAVCAADEAIVVTTPHVGAIRDADKVLSLLDTYGLHSVSVVVNRVRGDLVAGGSMMNADDIARLLRHRALGYIPEDDFVTVYAQLGRLGKGTAKSDLAMTYTAENLINGTRRIYDCTKDYKGVFGKIKTILRRQL